MNITTIDILSNDIHNNSFYEGLKNENFNLSILFTSNESALSTNNCISNVHLNYFSSFSNQFRAANKTNLNIHGTISIVFSNNVTNFDIGIIGLVALFKENFPNVLFEINIPFKRGNDAYFRFRSILFSLRDWHLVLTGKVLFNIKNDTKSDRKINEPEGILPIIIINDVSFTELFVKTNEAFDLDAIFKNIDQDQIREELEHQLSISYATQANYAVKNYRAIRETVKRFQNDIVWQNNNRIYFQHYLQLLSEFDFLPQIIEPYIKVSGSSENRVQSFRKKGLGIAEMNKLRKVMAEIILKLRIQPPFFTLLFSVLVNRNLDKSIDNLEDYINRVRDLYEFTRNLFLGLREIARNIIEHTDSKKGVIMGRVYTGDIIVALKDTNPDDGQSPIIDQYFKGLKIKGYMTRDYSKKSFLDIQLFDEGQLGIINKTISNIKTLAGNSTDHKNLYVQDLLAFNNKEINFSDFYNPSEIKLHHHAIKSASHWGLIVFTNLIHKNNGLFFVSSVANPTDASFDSCCKFSESIISPVSNKSHFSTGTYYDIILPLDTLFNLSDENLINTIPKESNFSEQNFIQLFKYSYETNIRSIKDDGRFNMLDILVKDYVDDSTRNIYRFENIIAKKIAGVLKKINHRKRKFMPVINFHECEYLFDQSKLIRFLAELQNNIDIYSFIILNVQRQIIIDLENTLSESFLNTANNTMAENSFWNDEHFILIYSYNIDEIGSRIYVSDILAGATYQDFFILNQKLSNTHFTDGKYAGPAKGTLSQKTLESIATCPFYIAGTEILQNFEMIIEHQNKSLFEHSVEYLLNQEINY